MSAYTTITCTQCVVGGVIFKTTLFSDFNFNEKLVKLKYYQINGS